MIGVGELPPSPSPVGRPISSDVAYLSGFIGRSLTIYDRSWATVCELCVTLPTLENGKAKIVEREDGSKGIDETFEIIPGLSWDDGVPVSSADIVFSVEVAHQIGQGAANLPNIREVIALDDRHFVIRTNTVRFDYNTFVDLFLIPAHIEQAVFRNVESPKPYPARSIYWIEPSHPGLYNGPYRVESFSPTQVVLGRNKAWPGSKPVFDTIVLRRNATDVGLEDDLINGKIDMIAGELGIDTDAAFSLEKNDTKSRFDFIFKSDLEYDHLDLNFKNPFLADQRVRRALLMSLDRAKLFSTNQPPDVREIPASFLPPTSPNYDPTLKIVRYDLQAADAVLDAAGYTTGPDGIRADSSGRRLSFRVLSQNHDHPIISKLRAQWAEAGVEVTLDNRPFRETMAHRDFDIAYYSWQNTPEFLIEPVYAKSGIPGPDNGFAGLNFPGFDNPEMNRIAAALTVEMDSSQRLILWQRAQQIYADALPALPLAFVTNAYVVPNWLAGVEPTGHMIPTSYWVENWHIR